MICPFCGHKHDRVIDSRESKEGDDEIRKAESEIGDAPAEFGDQ